MVTDSELLPETPPRKYTLLELLSLSQRTEEALLGLDLEELTEMTAEKVDNYIFMRDDMRVRAEKLAEYVKAFQATKTALENKADALEKRMMWVMETAGHEIARGKLWRVSVGSREVVTPLREPLPIDLLENSELVKQTLSWRKDDIKKAIKRGDKINFAAMVNNKHLRVGVNTNVK